MVKTIGDLDPAAAVVDTDLFEVEKSGPASEKATAAQVRTYVLDGFSGGSLNGQEEVHTSAVTVDNSRKGKMLIANRASTITFTLSDPTAVDHPFVFLAKNIGAGRLVLNASTGGSTINGFDTVDVEFGESVLVWSTGSVWRTAIQPRRFVTAEDFGAVFDDSAGDRALIHDAARAALAADRSFYLPNKGLDKAAGVEVRVPEDEPTVQEAHNNLLDWRFPGAVPGLTSALENHLMRPIATISIAEGERVSVGEGYVWNHPFGRFIRVKGRGKVGLTLNSFVSATFSSGVHLVTIRFTSLPASMAVGRIMRIIAPTGVGTHVHALDGAWRITAVSGNDVTLAVFYRSVAVPLSITSLSGGIYVYLPVKLRFTNMPFHGADTGGFDVHSTLWLEDVAISGQAGGTNAASTNGIFLRYRSSLFLGQHVGVVEWQRSGLWCLAGSFAQVGFAGFSGNGSAGINNIQGVVDGARVACTGNSANGYTGQIGSSCSIVQSEFSGNGDDGVFVSNGGCAIVSGRANGNVGSGLQTLNRAFIHGNNIEAINNTDFDLKRVGEGGQITMVNFSTIGTASPPVDLTDPAGGVTTGNDTDVPSVLKGSVVWNPPSIATGAQASTTITVTGSAVGRRAEVWANVNLQGLRLWGECTASNTVTAFLSNNTGAAVDLGAFTVFAKVLAGEV